MWLSSIWWGHTPWGLGMADSKRTSPERVAAFSDGVFAVISTIMVLELKPPHQYTFTALGQLWPMLLS
jgi:uncharacterized membrane protein